MILLITHPDKFNKLDKIGIATEKSLILLSGIMTIIINIHLLAGKQKNFPNSKKPN